MNIDKKTGLPKLSHPLILMTFLISACFFLMLIFVEGRLLWLMMLILSLIVVAIPQAIYSVLAEHYVRTLSDRTSPTFYLDNPSIVAGENLIPKGVIGRHIPATYHSLVMAKAPWVFSPEQQMDAYVIKSVHELMGMDMDELLDFAVAQWEMGKRHNMGSASKLATFDDVLDSERDRIVEEWEDNDHSDILFGLIGDSLEFLPFKEKDILFYIERLYTLSFNRQVTA